MKTNHGWLTPPIQKWVKLAVMRDFVKHSEKLDHLIGFLNNYYSLYFKRQLSEEHDKSQSALYKERVFDILNASKEKKEDLHQVQLVIEELTMKFDEKSMFKSIPKLLSMLISKHDVCAKDYLKDKLCNKDDIELLSEFGQYTIEALIIHVLCIIMKKAELKEGMVRAASLVELLESSVRTQASLLKRRRHTMDKENLSQDQKSQDMKSDINQKQHKLYSIGTNLIQFMLNRELITILDSSGAHVKEPRIQKSKGAYFIANYNFVVCNFNIELLPIKLNLPMVCKPLDWGCADPHDQKVIEMSDLSGGYLSSPTGEIYDRFRLLSSNNINNFYISFREGNNYKKLCSVMNKLQSQAFKINSEWLKYLLENKDLFVQNGLLMPSIIGSMNLKNAITLLRELYHQESDINSLCSYTELYNFICKSIQCARYEQFILLLSQAYDGYQFYLPAFLDFRGRIYRSGVLHFHDRDLARSLIIFADDSKPIGPEIKQSLSCCNAFHYKSFDTLDEVEIWSKKMKDQLKNDSDLIEYSRSAKHPFQFLAGQISMKCCSHQDSSASAYRNMDLNKSIPITQDSSASAYRNMDLNKSIPITQDASASAYQIMSYFLLDETLAKRTNLIRSADGKIQDVYSFFLEELTEFMKSELVDSLSKIVCKHLNREIVKGIFMPIIYGKTKMSVACDLKNVSFFNYFTNKEIYEVAAVCFNFWRTKYQRLDCLIQLIRNIGWIASARDRPVYYKVPYFTTVQDYMKTEPINIWVYDIQTKKRRRVTLRVASSNRDRRKTEISTFVNFIHQRDASIAMKVVDSMLTMGAPIYTVHDNFITTAEYSHLIPESYSSAICSMGSPLLIINEFIYMNVIQPIGGIPYDRDVIPFHRLNEYLMCNLPQEKISKQLMATWDAKITGIATSYKNYIRCVSGDSKDASWEAHQEKWINFQLQMKLKTEEGQFNYCVHY